MRPSRSAIARDRKAPGLMRPCARGWSKLKLAKELGMPENSVRRLLDLRHSSHMWIIDAALAKMNAELTIDLPKARAAGRAV
jgi:hypothetical protein